MDEGVVIPDAIDPVVGWKAVAVGPDVGMLASALGMELGPALFLRSPAYAVPWPKREPLESVCLSGDRYSLVWVKTESEFEADISHSLYANLELQSTKYLNDVGPYPGRGWKLAQRISPPSHDSPADGCWCGIHIAASKLMALEYMGAGWINALVEVYGWGKTISGTRGWRCQYVYPKKIILLWDGWKGDASLLKEVAASLSSGYGVPVEISTSKKVTKEAMEERTLFDRIAKPTRYTGVPMAKMFAAGFALSTAVLALGTMTILLNIRNRSGWEVILDVATMAIGVFVGLKGAKLTANAWRSR